MFKKKPNIKPLSPIRSSERRKIADQIISDYGIEQPVYDSKEDENQDDVSSTSSTLSILRNSLLPDGSLSAKFTTTTGPELSQVSGTIYVGGQPGKDQRVLWFEFENRLIPTVYTLWQHPGLVPLLHTQDLVLRKLQGGADLMTPGLARGPPFPSNLVKGSLVAVASVEKPSVPRFVGVCEIDVSSLEKVHGMKGHAVRGYHWDGDEIWSWSQTGKPGLSAPEAIDGWDTNEYALLLDQGMEALSVTGDNNDTNADDGGVRLDLGVENRHHEDLSNEPPDIDNTGLTEKEFADEKQMKPQEIDDAFRNAFLFSVHQQLNMHKDDPRHGLSFPISQSLVISNHVQPYLPTWTTVQANSLQIKKTSWKNVKKFIKALHKDKILLAKDRDGGETVILDIDFDHPAVIGFVPYKLPRKENKGAGSSNAAKTKNTNGDETIGQRLNMLKLYKPRSQLSPIFEASGSSVKDLFLSAEIRTIIINYIENQNLISTNKRLINLDPILANAIFDGSSSLDSEVIANGSVPREALIDRFVETCSPFWALLRNEETRETTKAKAGPSPRILMRYETRSGNKTVTKISGLETFYINPQLLADELQKSCASSTSVGALVGSSPKTPVMEVLVQGPQKDAVYKALEKRGVHRNWVDMVNKTKGGKTK